MPDTPIVNNSVYTQGGRMGMVADAMVHWWRDGHVAACGYTSIPDAPQLNGLINCHPCYQAVQRDNRPGIDVQGKGAR